MGAAHGFGQRLEALRMYRGYSQDSLTHKLGLSPGTVARWERELESPKRSQLLLLSDCLCVSVDEIVGEPDSLGRTVKRPIVHSLGLRRFLQTADGKLAQQKKLDHPLRDLPADLTAEQYRQLTTWLLSLIELEPSSP
jgi:transcriptional regulator with XRE-family HTH domain